MQDLQDLQQIRQMIQQGQKVRLSTKFTKPGTLLTAVFVAGFSFFILPTIVWDISLGNMGLLLAGILMLVMIGFALFQLIYAAEATLEGKQLFLKKVMGGSYDLNVSQVEKISSIKLRRTKYTFIKFIDSQGITSKALIMNSNSAIFGVEPGAGDVIKMAQQM